VWQALSNIMNKWRRHSRRRKEKNNWKRNCLIYKRTMINVCLKIERRLDLKSRHSGKTEVD
jgi:hypothetical protein